MYKTNKLTPCQVLALKNGQINKENLIEVLDALTGHDNMENYILHVIGLYNPIIPKHKEVVTNEKVYTLVSYNKFTEEVEATYEGDNGNTGYKCFHVKDWNNFIPVSTEEESVVTADPTFEEWLRDKAAIVNQGWVKKNNELAFFITTNASNGQDVPNVGCHKMTVAGTVYFESITKAAAIAKEAKQLGYIK